MPAKPPPPPRPPPPKVYEQASGWPCVVVLLMALALATGAMSLAYWLGAQDALQTKDLVGKPAPD
jgi:hypothetical protein